MSTSPTSKPHPQNSEASSSKQPTTMSKAEQSRQRRAIQEQQRAAKAAGKAAGKATGNSPPAPNSNQNRPRSGSKAAPNTTSKKEKGGQHFGKLAKDKDIASVAGDDLASSSRGLRIFSHFGLPKTVSHIAKGNVHPAIVRLGLQFSDFKISGANARCIATLTAFKAVRQTWNITTFQSLTFIYLGNTRLCHTSRQYALPGSNDSPVPSNNTSGHCSPYVRHNGECHSTIEIGDQWIRY